VLISVRLITVLISVRLITVLISVRLPGSHCNGLTSPRSHRPTGQARPPMLTSRFSAHLDLHLLAHVLSVPVDGQPLRMHYPDPMAGDRNKSGDGPRSRVSSSYQ
jgi:hypothetical protein